MDFDSSESSAANRPQLTITYSVPPSSTDTEPPTSPGNLRQTDVTSTTAMLAWDAATDNVGVVGYKVNRDGQLVATVAGTSYEDTELQPGTAYDYTVAAYDAANNESVPAGPLAVTTDTVPLSHVQDISLQVVDAGPTRHATSQVTVLDGTAQPVADATVQADWSGLASGAVSGITLVDGTVSFASDDVPSAVFGQLVFTVTDVSAAGYFYDEASNSETADCITTAGTDCHSVPGAPVAPTGLTALGALSAIDLDWDNSADTSVTGYTVYRSATSGSGFQPLVSIASSAYSDGTVGAGVPYYYAVVAYYSSGAASPFSGEAWAVAGETTLSFQDGVSPVAIYAGTRDTYIAQADPSTNAGSGVDLQADGDDPPSSGNDLSSLLAWDLSAIPNGAVIQSASIEIEVYNVSTGSYQFYEVKRDWSESEATWNQAASGSSWTSAGASHEADDRGSQVLATISASATGTYSVDLGPDGLAVLQAWVDGERPNNGFILADSGTTDGLDFHSSEASTAAYRPKLTLSYVIPDPNQAPSASFTATPGTGEFSLNVNFDASGSSDPDGTIADYAWDFGDGTGGSGATPLHSYGAAGTYNAELTVTDDDGATDISNLAVVVTEPPNQAPSASFTATPGTGQSSLNVNFDASGSSDPDGTIADYAWDFGDGTGGSGVNASHSYSAAGTYDAELTVTDNDGATGVANHTIVVSEPPPTGPAISTGTVTGVGSSGWTTVILPRSYTSMVVVASTNYDSGSVPGVVRIQNAAVDRFDVRMDVAANSGDITGASIHYVVVEEGVYTAAEHGVSMEAVKFDSTLTDRSGSWVGTAQTYANVYSDPVVIGQVMSYNDSGFSVFWARGSSRKNPPSAGSLYVGKHVAQDADKTRADETIGYLVIEAGQGTVGGLAYAAGAGADNVWGVTNSPPYGYATSGLQNATTAVVSSAAMDGGDGGWPVLYGSNPVGGGSLSLAIDEDQIKDTERNHTSEQVAYLVLGPAAP